ncbi:hypothetical protein BHM34_00025 [Salmonella enterica subsp. enterica serovar Toucra]|nr:hypothetical protein [Salmonella enterica subsp. enterica serovar Blockley]ECA0736815.1 hypothetical protein [Salmonella enterica subsp. enterica serovar Adelaide]ECU7989949.1 hypothetical protein [Salmonella enterica subsp. enterica serovar Toucra]
MHTLTNYIMSPLLTMSIFYSGMLAIYVWKKHSNKSVKFGDIRREYEAALAKGLYPILLASIAYLLVFWLLK